VWSAVAAMTSTVRSNVFAVGFVVSDSIEGLRPSCLLSFSESVRRGLGWRRHDD
jgi:hypothetical protein